MMFVNLLRYIVGMKVKLILSLLLAAFLLVPHSVVLASSDKAFNTTRLNKFGSVAIVLGNKFGFDISGFIIPFFNKERQTAVPDFYPGADFKEGISQYTLPQSKVDLGKIINWNEAENPVFLTALYGAILQTDAEHSNHPEKTDCFITETMERSSDLPDAPTHFQWGQWLNGIYGIRELLPTDEGTGVHDFNRPSLVIAGMNPNEDCKKHELGFELEKAENDTEQLAAFGAGTETEGHEVTTIMTIVEKIIDGIMTLVEEPETEPHKDDVILTMDQKQPWFNFMCNDYWCPGNETSDDSSETDKTGGWTNFLFSFHQQEKVLAASLQPYKIKILNFPQKPIEKSYDAFNQSEYGMKGAGCSVSPYTPEKNIQEDLTLGGKVKIIDRCIPAPTPADMCSIPGTNGQVTGDIAAAVTAAAQQTSIPHCVLDGVAQIEGAYTATSCTPNECGALGPFAITIGYTFSEQNGQCSKDTACNQCAAGSCPNALGETFSGTGLTEADLCNAETAAVAAAQMLKGKASFFGHDLTGTDSDVGNITTAIIAAGNAYFGSNHVFESGSNIEPGCSYGESIVRKYCGYTAYTCGTNNVPVN